MRGLQGQSKEPKDQSGPQSTTSGLDVVLGHNCISQATHLPHTARAFKLYWLTETIKPYA